MVYESPLREARTAQTKERILDAAVSVLATGIANFTVPAVAERGGVAVPTVYSHFPNKEILVEEAGFHVRRKFGVLTDESLSGLDELLEHLRGIYRRAESHPAELRAALWATAGLLMDLDHRRRELEERLGDDLGGVRGEDRRCLIDALVLLHGSTTAMSLARYGIEGEEAADLVAWMTTTLLRGALAQEGDG